MLSKKACKSCVTIFTITLMILCATTLVAAKDSVEIELDANTATDCTGGITVEDNDLVIPADSSEGKFTYSINAPVTGNYLLYLQYHGYTPNDYITIDIEKQLGPKDLFSDQKWRYGPCIDFNASADTTYANVYGSINLESGNNSVTFKMKDPVKGVKVSKIKLKLNNPFSTNSTNDDGSLTDTFVWSDGYIPGGSGTAYHPTVNWALWTPEHAFGIRFIDTAGWCKYPVDIEEDGYYDVFAVIAGGLKTSRFQIFIEEENKTLSIAPPLTYNTYSKNLAEVKCDKSVYLNKGKYTFTISSPNADGLDSNFITFRNMRLQKLPELKLYEDSVQEDNEINAPSPGNLIAVADFYDNWYSRAVIIAAVYKGEELFSMHTMPSTSPINGGRLEMNFNIPEAEFNESDYNIKLYLWNGFDSLNPHIFKRIIAPDPS